MTKKIVPFAIAIMIAFALSGNVAATSDSRINIISPTGGSIFEYGQDIPVTFTNTYPNAVSKVEIVGTQSGGTISKTRKPNKNIQTVNFSTQNVLLPGEYFVRITAYRSGRVLETKVGDTFTIVPKPGIQVTAPQEGAQWYKGQTYIIAWETQTASKVYISAATGGHDLGMIAVVDGNIHQYAWTIPNEYGAGFDLGNVKIRVMDANNASIYGDSGYFAILG